VIGGLQVCSPHLQGVSKIRAGKSILHFLGEKLKFFEVSYNLGQDQDQDQGQTKSNIKFQNLLKSSL